MMALSFSAWHDPIFKNFAIGVMVFILVFGLALFPFRKTSKVMQTAWVSWMSWTLLAPLIIGLLSVGQPWPILGFVLLSLFSCKELFRMMGIYHRTMFVWLTYTLVIVAGFCIVMDWKKLFDLLPMIHLGLLTLIPLIRNSFKQMLQYIAISIIVFMFVGWASLHLAWISKLEFGARHLLYILFLTEFADSVILSLNRVIGRVNFIDKIAPRRSLEGLLLGILLTLVVAYYLRFLLPKPDTLYWLSAGLTAVLVGALGDITLGVIRRDLGVKDVGTFIIGRGGIVDRLDRLIFVAPIYYYIHSLLPL